MISRTTLLLLVPMVLSILSCGDKGTQSKDNPPSRPAFEINGLNVETQLPSYVNIFFQVLDKDGIGVTDLTTEDFTVQEDGQPVSPSESFMNIRKAGAIPYELKTVLLLDISLSVGDNIEEIKDAAKAMVSQVAPYQRFAVYTFSDEITLVQDFTNSVSALTSSINTIQLGNPSTNLYGAILTGLDLWYDTYSVIGVQQGFLIVLTDGQDTAGEHDLTEVLNSIQYGDAKRVYTVGVGNEVDPEILEQIGSAGYFLIDDFSQLTDQFDAIQDEMALFAESFYWLNYLSPKRGDNYHTLRLSLTEAQSVAYEANFSSSGFVSPPHSPFAFVFMSTRFGGSGVYLQNELGIVSGIATDPNSYYTGLSYDRTNSVVYTTEWPVQDWRYAEIVKIAADGGSVVRLTNNIGYDGEAAVSPNDGSEVVFTSDRADTALYPEIYVMNSSGGNVRRIVENNSSYPPSISADYPCWEPSGQAVYFLWNPDGYYHAIYKVDVSGGTPTLIYSPPSGHYVGCPDVSPDESKLVFRESFGSSGSLLVMYDIQSEEKEFVLGGYSETIWDPKWSPDGEYIIYSYRNQYTEDDIYMLEITTDEVTRLTYNAAYDYSPDW